MRATWAGLAAVVVVLATGCGGASTASETPTSSSTTELDPAAWASVIAGKRADIDDIEEGLVQCGYGQNERTTVCLGAFARSALDSEFLARDLRQLGTPPAAVADITESTLAAADLLADGEQGQCEDAPQSIECTAATANARLSIRDLQAEMDAWKPYGA